jgi:hypothetical protein
MPMNISASDDSSSLLPITEQQNRFPPGTGAVDTETVRVAPLYRFLSEKEIIRPALFKVDVQGFATRKHFTQRTKQRKMIQTWSRRSRRFNIKWDMPRGRLYPQGGGNANTEPPTYMWRAGLDQTYACWRRNQGSTSSGVAVV